MTKEELVKTLNWMLELRIITHNEYNHLYQKSLPFTKKTYLS